MPFYTVEGNDRQAVGGILYSVLFVAKSTLATFFRSLSMMNFKVWRDVIVFRTLYILWEDIDFRDPIISTL
jgi:hypothetical protein